MLPAQLTSASFANYHTRARDIANQSLPLLQQLPLGFTPFLLKEIVDTDVKFPIELKELKDQLAYLKRLTPEERGLEMQPFSSLKLSAALESFDWVNSPGQFLEKLSAHLWATHQMDGFRAASETYVHKFRASLRPDPLPTARLGVVVIGQDVVDFAAYQPFVKIRREGTLYDRVDPRNGLAVIHAALEKRAKDYSGTYAHWCLDGGMAPTIEGFSTVGYGQLAAVRDALKAKMLDAYQARHFDPEMLRTTLARTSYESLGIETSDDAPLEHFSLALLTEGSGTQIYSTTFVQWAAREALRRAQPLTLFARYAPRQREQPMDELLRGTASNKVSETDPLGSLIDGDLGAYYTWLNQQRLPGADQARFLVWFENQSRAVVVSSLQKRGAIDSTPMDMATLLDKVIA